MGVFLQNTFAVAANDDVCLRQQTELVTSLTKVRLAPSLPARIMMNAKDRALQTHKQKMNLGMQGQPMSTEPCADLEPSSVASEGSAVRSGR